MRARLCLPLAALSSALLFFALPALPQGAAQQTGDPVAGAARKSREAKKNAPKPHKVYTDDDVSRPKPAPPITPAPGTPGALPPGTSPTAPTANTSAADQDAKTEAAWRQRFKNQRDKIARAEKDLDILQREEEKNQIQYYPDPQKAMNEQYTRKDINEKREKIEAKRQEIAQLKQGLSDLEDDLRKAGGDSGWSRE
jgi:cell division protein FtsL